MPPQYVDFGSHIPTSVASDDDKIHRECVPGAWIDCSNLEESSDPNMTKSKARAIAKEALAGLRRAADEAENERLHRQTLKMKRAAEGKRSPSAAAEGDKQSIEHPMSIRAIIAPDTLHEINAPVSAPRRTTIAPSLNPGESYHKPSYAVAAHGDASNTPANQPRRSPGHPLLNSGEQKAGGIHGPGFLSLMDDFNARGRAKTAATRRLVDGGFISEHQFAAAAAREKPRVDARALDGEDRLAAVRARLANKGRGVATSSQQVSRSESRAVKGVPPMPVRPGPAQPCITLGNSTLPTRMMEICVSVGPSQQGFSTTTNGVKQPAANHAVHDLSPTGRSKAEIEAARSDNGHSVSGTLRISDYRKAPKPSSAEPATVAAASTTTTTPRQSVSQKAQAIALRYATNASRQPAQNAATPAAQKSAQGADHIHFDAGKETSTKLTAAPKTTFTTPSRSVSERVQAILHHYEDAVSALDDVSVAAFVARKLNEDTNRTDFDAGKKPSTPAKLKTPSSPTNQSAKGLGLKPDVVDAAEVADGFDVVSGKGPSAANGSPLPDRDLMTDQLDVHFPPTLKAFQGWEDDYDSDDSEEWDLGGLAEWKWVGEKSAKESSTAKRKA